MTDRELMQQALAVLQKHVDYYDYEQFTSMCELEPAKDLILALRERLAQPEQEPVACIGTNGDLMWLNKPQAIYSKAQPLYTAPLADAIRARGDKPCN